MTTAKRKTFRLVTVGLGSDLYFGQSTKVRISFDLPAGVPRSGSNVRVGPAFATFLAWAFGDHGTVRIDVPAAFTVDVSGETMAKQAADNGGQTFTASTDDALAWYAWVNARNDDGLTRERLDLPDGERILVRGWPEDAKWRRRVSVILSDSVPNLVGRIGLPWPVDGPLNVLEVHTPLLEGYAGFYDPKRDEITISENLDDVTIIHEASHAWFNGNLFTDRWINEGLAEEYASRVLASETRGHADPAPIKRTAKAAFALGAWPPPAPIRDATSDAREQYGYDAAWTVIRELVDEVGEDGMRRVFQAADHHTIAYPGDGTPETTTQPNDWRRFLDLRRGAGWRIGGRPAADVGPACLRRRPAARPRRGAGRLRAARGRVRRMGGAGRRPARPRRLAVRRGRGADGRRAGDRRAARGDRGARDGERAHGADGPGDELRVRGLRGGPLGDGGPRRQHAVVPRLGHRRDRGRRRAT